MDDDAWYSVKVDLKGETLSIEFHGVQETVKFAASNFESENAIDRLVRRFRVVSPQLQVRECPGITEGSLVCAVCNTFGGDDTRYYDAVVEAVDRRDHSFVKGECLCTFVLSWLHGPKVGLLTNASIASICTVNDDGQIDPIISSFSKLAKRKVLNSSGKNTVVSANEVSARLALPKGGWNQLLFIDDKRKPSFQDIQNKWESIYGNGESAGVETLSDHDCHQDQDQDLGGEPSNCFFIVIGNMERSLSPASIQEFINRHACVSPEVYVLPSPLPTHFTKAVLLLDTKKKHDKVCQFLDNPDHFVVSMSGRPWVLIECDTKLGINGNSLGSLADLACDQDDSYSDNEVAMVVHSGSEAYRRAKRLKELFMDFSNHEQLLLKRLKEEEARVL
ncbi:unnamed protein product [Cuscuta epithymum]|uniref:SAWADEE domain-containing protein n=1 Tax=Cuscuta epithymum TaxID=186058 RepID=A0AAV0D8S8_9ASTE|nr:unnamed protein product [Cuscuta epithymum]